MNSVPADGASRSGPVETLTSDDDASGSPGAWGLEFGQVAQEQPSVVELLQNVMGQDDRKQVADARQFPWNRICYLRLHYQSGTTAVGTGWMVGPRTVLTAGHCVHQRRFGWAKSVEVIPGWNGEPLEAAPFGVHVATRCLSVRAWVERKQGAYDCGAVILPETSVFAAPFIPFEAAPDGTLQGQNIDIAGYPVDRTMGTMWSDTQPLSATNSTYLFYDVDTEDGQSGAAVLAQRADGPVAVGLHTDGSNRGNFGIRITEELVQIFQRWAQG